MRCGDRFFARVLLVAMRVCAAATTACMALDGRVGGSDTAADTGGSTPDTTTIPASDTGAPAVCEGVCVHTALATYTGPSLFWIGWAGLVPDCPPETPY